MVHLAGFDDTRECWVERSAERGGFSLYACLVYISPKGRVESAHRKLMPTGGERTVWAQGDGSSLLAGAQYYWFFTALMLVTAVLFVFVARGYEVRAYIQPEQ